MDEATAGARQPAARPGAMRPSGAASRPENKQPATAQSSPLTRRKHVGRIVARFNSRETYHAHHRSFGCCYGLTCTASTFALN